MPLLSRQKNPKKNNLKNYYFSPTRGVEQCNCRDLVLCSRCFWAAIFGNWMCSSQPITVCKLLQTRCQETRCLPIHSVSVTEELKVCILVKSLSYIHSKFDNVEPPCRVVHRCVEICLFVLKNVTTVKQSENKVLSL